MLKPISIVKPQGNNRWFVRPRIAMKGDWGDILKTGTGIPNLLSRIRCGITVGCPWGFTSTGARNTYDPFC